MSLILFNFLDFSFALRLNYMSSIKKPHTSFLPFLFSFFSYTVNFSAYKAYSLLLTCELLFCSRSTPGSQPLGSFPRLMDWRLCCHSMYSHVATSVPAPRSALVSISLSSISFPVWESDGRSCGSLLLLRPGTEMCSVLSEWMLPQQSFLHIKHSAKYYLHFTRMCISRGSYCI